MAKQLVEILDRKGHVVDRYVIELEDEDCHDFEYEEAALLHAEKSGRIAEGEFVHIRARCVR